MVLGCESLRRRSSHGFGLSRDRLLLLVSRTPTRFSLSIVRWAPMFITDKTQGEDEAYYLLEFEGGALGIIENIWGSAGGNGRQSKSTVRTVIHARAVGG